MSRLCDYETPDSENLNIVKMDARDVLLSNCTVLGSLLKFEYFIHIKNKTHCALNSKFILNTP